jgi:hypothetical protein
MLTQSADSISTIIIIAIFLVPVFMIFSFAFGDCKTYTLEEDGIKSGNLIRFSGKKIFYRDIISVESRVFEYPVVWFSHRDFKITIKHTSGKLDVFIPGGYVGVISKKPLPRLTKKNDHAEFMKILGEKIGKAKIKYYS